MRRKSFRSIAAVSRAPETRSFRESVINEKSVRARRAATSRATCDQDVNRAKDQPVGRPVDRMRIKGENASPRSADIHSAPVSSRFSYSHSLALHTQPTLRRQVPRSGFVGCAVPRFRREPRGAYSLMRVHFEQRFRNALADAS